LNPAKAPGAKKKGKTMKEGKLKKIPRSKWARSGRCILEVKALKLKEKRVVVWRGI